MLTRLQDLVIELLVTSGVSRETITVIMLLLDQNQMLYELTDFIETNPQASEQEIFSRSVEIKDGYQLC